MRTMLRSVRHLLGVAAVLAVSLLATLLGAGAAHAHPGHGHEHRHALAAAAVAVTASAVRPDATVVHAAVETAAEAAAVAMPVTVTGAVTSDGAAPPDAPPAAGCTVPGCCGGGPCSACCSMVPPVAVLVWPARAAPVHGVHAAPALHDAVSSGLKRPPRSFG
ncbi:hypothetical protein PQJ75_02095 [Rhodoplanes sp. TEM]|uniref:Uncharacterized protein n=1 Tax=Rhodoplanes tepidamans TaxID=200616 RepID=A0ABT5J5X6_RHOTP|nr:MULTISPECIES: hypothetical protein [Rhodoplanes]MDC7785039.1 hypothetical protein [Rhodoplanes tepidamans]MDC7982513.1 hypothetical protein [Rhodoplanes sp. TEM]MDQ0356527.1 hypothetical protein [Rhodoplanes tepidamans]